MKKCFKYTFFSQGNQKTNSHFPTKRISYHRSDHSMSDDRYWSFSLFRNDFVTQVKPPKKTFKKQNKERKIVSNLNRRLLS